MSAFEIDRTEVTVAAFEACRVEEGCAAPGGGLYCWGGNLTYEDHPINCVGWQHADQYCAWAGKRLCTEAEWEKAARGTDGRRYAWGDDFTHPWLAAGPCEYAVHSGCWAPFTYTTPVGSRPLGRSPYGAFDMAGNVAEWVADHYAADYYESAPAVDPSGPASGATRVVRGGSHQSVPSALRVSDRQGPPSWGFTHGFRCCKSMP